VHGGAIQNVAYRFHISNATVHIAQVCHQFGVAIAQFTVRTECVRKLKAYSRFALTAESRQAAQALLQTDDSAAFEAAEVTVLSLMRKGCRAEHLASQTSAMHRRHGEDS
jgi:hypothetical protein